MFGMAKKQSFINFSRYSINSYASLVLRDSEVTFLEEGKDATFCPFLYCILFIDSVED